MPSSAGRGCRHLDRVVGSAASCSSMAHVSIEMLASSWQKHRWCRPLGAACGECWHCGVIRRALQTTHSEDPYAHRCGIAGDRYGSGSSLVLLKGRLRWRWLRCPRKHRWRGREVPLWTVCLEASWRRPRTTHPCDPRWFAVQSWQRWPSSLREIRSVRIDGGVLLDRVAFR